MNEHGDDIYRYPHTRLNFSSNIWGHADLSALQAHLASRPGLIGHYPEPDARSLAEVIARQSGIAAEEVLVTNGATEAIHLIRQCFATYRHSIPQPTFSEYGPGEADAGPDRRPTVHWWCNPNNPTGQCRRLPPLLPESDLFVIDQAYEDYTLRPMLGDAEAVRQKNVVVLHSLTKKFCIPGLRVGYAVAHAAIISRLRAAKQPWSVNALAIEAGKFLLGRHARVLPPLPWLLGETRRLRSLVNALPGMEALPTDTQFFLIRLHGKGSSAQVKQRLAAEGILVRDCSSFAGLRGPHIRVATQLPAENDQLAEALSRL